MNGSGETSAPKCRSAILVLTTGGTIDKQYFDAVSRYQITDSVIAKLLSIARVTHAFQIEEVLKKDSLEITDEDRALLVTRVQGTPFNRIVITHGTDTMTRTAQALRRADHKTIVLTGALSPARFSDSDAAFNLGMAFAAVQIASPGVYIAMNGTVSPADIVRKDYVQGAFVAQ
jgi:L-asparaginase